MQGTNTLINMDDFSINNINKAWENVIGNLNKNIYSSFVFLNMPIRTNFYLTKCIKRTWKERLFTIPWRPLKRFNRIPDDKFYIINNTILCHPAFKIKLLKLLSKMRECL